MRGCGWSLLVVSALLCFVGLLRLLGTLKGTSDPYMIAPVVMALIIVCIPGIVGLILIFLGKKPTR